MKTFKTSIVALLLLAAISCKKDSTSASLTSDQAADVAASALASNSGGVTSMADDISANASTVASVGGPSINSVGVATIHQACGTTLTDSTTRSGSDSSVTFNYFTKYTHTLNCNAQEQPDNLVNTLIYTGSFSGPRISTTANGTANATIAGLTQTAINYVINGEYKRTGTFQSKVGNKASGNSNLDVVITNLTLSKPGRAIVSGSGTFTLTGTAGKVDYSYSGTITFNGNGTVTLSVTGGSSYNIRLASGVCTRR
ncbi:MAG TPA: hypothetical protein VFE54_15255 [Mucilaginibacter sp.]|nr:hypothetical protein [Mucilaginibacter sp.]